MGAINDYVIEHSELTIYEKKLLEVLTQLYDDCKPQLKKFQQLVDMARDKYSWVKNK